jgi:ABC-type transport system substrate-binding protein
MTQTTRRQFLRSIGLGAAGTLLAACAPPAPPAATPAPAKPAATAQVVPTMPPPAPKPTDPPAAAPKPAAQAPTQAPSSAVKDANFVAVDGTEPSGLDPAIHPGPPQHPVNAMYDGLVHWNTKMEAVPALATSWEPSPDGKVWTFKLREGVKFHDGTPFNAQAVKATVDHMMDKDSPSPRRASYTLIQEIQTPDDHTVRFVTDPPTPDFPFLMADQAVKIVSPTALQKFGKDFGRNPVGTGPYAFEEWVPNDHVSAVINPDYWGPKPQVRRFVYRPIPEAAGRVIALKTGEADIVMNLPAADFESLRQDSNVVTQATPGLTVVQVEPRMSKPPFDDARVRIALNQAVDKDAIIANVMRGLARPLNTPSIPGLWGTFEFEPFAYDPARARQLLAEAGHPNGFEVTVYYISGRWAGDDQVVEAVQG